LKTLIGIATFGGLNFTRLAVQSVRETVLENDYEIFLVVGKPDDVETPAYATENKIYFTKHDTNRGFPASVNDIYDYAWTTNDFDNVIIMGNDVIAYPYAIDSLINTAKNTDYEWICSTQYDVRNLCDQFPDQRKYFQSGDYIFTDFQAAPWKEFTGYSKEEKVAEIGLSDVQNLCLYKRSVFDKIGYTDANFYPAYYIDNDYARRGVNADIRGCTIINSVYFHFWSRTIKQGSGGSTNKFFNSNREFYIQKWNGDFGQETWKIPFNGEPFLLDGRISLEGSLKISSRVYEEEVIKYWSSK
jgi:GT2 family glycosyltransferase